MMIVRSQYGPPRACKMCGKIDTKISRGLCGSCYSRQRRSGAMEMRPRDWRGWLDQPGTIRELELRLARLHARYEVAHDVADMVATDRRIGYVSRLLANARAGILPEDGGDEF